MNCRACGQEDELRFGVCFDCCRSGEERAAKRSVVQHLWTALKHLSKRQWYSARIDLLWAWERLTRTGDYAKGGTFDWEGYDWR